MSSGLPSQPAPRGAAPPVVATVWRDGVVESVHRGSVAVAAADGTILAALGDPARATYVRSAAKPFQALAMLELLAGAAVDVDARALAIACASHQGDDLQQIEAARLLALADLDESALRCPPALPAAQPRSAAGHHPGARRRRWRARARRRPPPRRPRAPAWPGPGTAWPRSARRWRGRGRRGPRGLCR